MRGFGAVQAASRYESQMDKLAAALGLDPVEMRIRNAAQRGRPAWRPARWSTRPRPWPSCSAGARPAAARLPVVDRSRVSSLSATCDCPAASRTPPTARACVRGVGYGVGIKNICFSEGFDDYSTARVAVEVVGGEPVVAVHTAAVEVGQGLVTLQAQIARTELGVAAVRSSPPTPGSAAPARRRRRGRRYVTGGAVQAACREVAASCCRRAASSSGRPASTLALADGQVVDASGAPVASLAALLGDEVLERDRRVAAPAHRRPLDPETGQGNAHVQFAFAAHRAVVDVDIELGLVKVVALDCAQDVGQAINPEPVLGQIHGGTAQGLGLAVMEEIQVVDGLVRNPSFTDYLIPTDARHAADARRRAGAAPTRTRPTVCAASASRRRISSTPAIVAAIRAATGLALHPRPGPPRAHHRHLTAHGWFEERAKRPRVVEERASRTTAGHWGFLVVYNGFPTPESVGGCS